MKIAVYLGANYGNNPKVNEETEKLGQYIGSHGHTLVYGGSRTGLMNTVAQATKQAHGKVIGVEMKMFYDGGFSLDGLDEFYVFDTLVERKQYMMNVSDAFIAMPGGTGTLDEISDIMCLDKLQEKHRPVILFNIDHFYDELAVLLDKMVTNGYLRQCDRDLISFVTSIDEIDKILTKTEA